MQEEWIENIEEVEFKDEIQIETPPLEQPLLAKETHEEGERQEDIDARSIYVGNVNYGTTPAELILFFRKCGQVNRVTIPQKRGTQKGFAYLEFEDIDAIDKAIKLDGTTFRARAVKICRKRTNIPGFNRNKMYPPRRQVNGKQFTFTKNTNYEES